MYWRCIFSWLVVLCVLDGQGAGVRASSTPAAQAAAPGMVVSANALQVAAENPRIVLAGTFRSTDGGATWTPVHLPTALTSQSGPGKPYSYDPPVSAIDGVHLYVNYGYWFTPDASGRSIAVSADGGVHWNLYPPEPTAAAGGGGGGNQLLAVSPATAGELYAYSDALELMTFLRSRDFGTTFQAMADPGALGHLQPGTTQLLPLLPDVTKAHVLYAAVGDQDDIPLFLAWSTNDGDTWRTVTLPAGLRADEVQLASDRHLPGLLILHPIEQPGVPADRSYTSADGGASWQQTTCPGDLRGVCPSSVVDNVFGSGASYGLYADGIHAFTGAGPAGSRLSSSAGLPVPPQDVRTLAGGTRYGDPVYLVGAPASGTADMVYSSVDGGRHWELAFAGILPDRAAPGAAHGALSVPQTDHSVAPGFVALYRALGLRITGYPVDEAYLRNGDLVQDFEHIEMVRHAGTSSPLIAPLGVDACALQCDPRALQPVSRSAAPTGSMYFPATRHTLRGIFLRFWRQHGGERVLGDPISEVFRAGNMDGSGRTYQMQYFTNVRLESHPEYHTAGFAVQLGLLGREALVRWGWTAATQ